MTVAQTIRFHFDFISPYAYLAWLEIHGLAEEFGAEVVPLPTLFAGLLDHHGTLGPAEVPAKREYVFRDCLRTAGRLGVPFAPPPHHPFNPLLALRVACVPTEAETQRRLIDSLFQMVWGGGNGAEDPAEVAAACAELGILDALARAAEPAVKARVVENGQAAIEAGAFGVPSMLIDGELFWGLDSLPNLRAYLAGARLPEDAMDRWAQVTPSAERPR